MSREPAIRNWKLQPPAGGWPFEWTSPTGRRYMLDSSSPRRIVEILMDIQKMNKWFVSEDHTWAECNDVWRAKDPARAIGGAPTLSQLPGLADITPLLSRTPVHQSWWDSKPQEWGPRAWMWLHTFGVSFDHQDWMSAINRISRLLDPSRTPEFGCFKCLTEWRKIIADDPPAQVANEQQAAAWSFKAHNRVNQHRGVTPITWNAAAKFHHWKVAV